ncbi:MAG: hypothetical protein J6I83_00435 [Firmicutes bacterium]|nr:hypothetical protein [Bacillota bacterium]
MSTNKKPKTGATVAKVIFGLLFFDVALAPDPEFDAASRGVGIILGAALLIWAYVPYRLWKKHRQEVMAEIEREEKEIDSLKEALRKRPWKCPHCGASTIGDVCEYCGSPKEYR